MRSRGHGVSIGCVKTSVFVLLVTCLAACGPDPNSLTGGGGRSARRTTSSTSGDTTSADESDDGSGNATGGGSTPGKPSSSPDSTPGGGTTTTPSTGAATAEQGCVDAINKFRTTLNLPPLQRWSAAESCSGTEAQSDGQTNRAHGAFPKCGENAQNECPGWPGPADQMITGCLQAMWDEGPGGGHHDNMASREWTQVSCGFATLPGGAVWSVQNFR